MKKKGEEVTAIYQKGNYDDEVKHTSRVLAQIYSLTLVNTKSAPSFKIRQ